MPNADDTPRTTRRALLGTTALGFAGFTGHRRPAMPVSMKQEETVDTFTLDVVIATSDTYPQNSGLVRKETELARYLPEYTTEFFQSNDVARTYKLGDIEYLHGGGEYCTDADVVSVFTKNDVPEGNMVIGSEPECYSHFARVSELNPAGSSGDEDFTTGELRDRWANIFVHEYLHEYGIGFPEQYEFQEHNKDTTGIPPLLSPWNHDQSTIEWDVMGAIDRYRDHLNDLNKAILKAHSPADPMSSNVEIPIYIDITSVGNPIPNATLDVWKRPLYIGEANELEHTGTHTADENGRVGPLELDTRYKAYHGLMIIKTEVQGMAAGGWLSVYDLRRYRYIYEEDKFVAELSVGPVSTTTNPQLDETTTGDEEKMTTHGLTKELPPSTTTTTAMETTTKTPMTTREEATTTEQIADAELVTETETTTTTEQIADAELVTKTETETTTNSNQQTTTYGLGGYAQRFIEYLSSLTY